LNTSFVSFPIQVRILERLTGAALPAAMTPVVALAQQLRGSPDTQLRGLSASLSTRQLLRIGRRLQRYPLSRAADLVERACLTRCVHALDPHVFTASWQRGNFFIFTVS